MKPHLVPHPRAKFYLMKGTGDVVDYRFRRISKNVSELYSVYCSANIYRLSDQVITRWSVGKSSVSAR